MTACSRRPAHASAAPRSSRNCRRYGSSAASVRSSAPPSRFHHLGRGRHRRACAGRGIVQQIAELLRQRIAVVGPARAARAVERVIDIGEVEDVRPVHDGRIELDRLDRILAAMRHQRAAHEDDRRQPVEQSQFAHGVGDIDCPFSPSAIPPASAARPARRTPRSFGRWPRPAWDGAERSRSAATGSEPPAPDAR